MILALSATSLVSWLAFDREAVSLLSQTDVNWNANFWVDIFTWLGKAWLQIWLLLLWFVVSHRRHDVLAGLLALIVGGIVVNPLKLAVDRTRPHAVVKMQATGQADQDVAHHVSFPSGDTAAAFGVTTAVLPAVGWPSWLLSLAWCAAIGGLRVDAMAHYPSDVLAGAAIGVLAGWLANRLMDKWGRADRALPFENWLVAGGIAGIPALLCLWEGPAEMLLLLRTYGLLVLCIVLAVKLTEAVRRGGFDRPLGFLARTRVVAVVLAFAAAITENMLDGKKPHELLPMDQPVSPMALLAFALVFAGASLRLWAQGHGARRGMLTQGPYAIARHPLHLGSFFVVSGLLLQLNDWMDWLVVRPVFVLFYGASLVREERAMERDFGEQWRSYKASTPAVIPSLGCLSLLRLRGSWSWSVRPRAAAIWTTLALVCLPWVIELLVEDFLFERVLGM